MCKHRIAKISDCDSIARIEYCSIPYEVREDDMHLNFFEFYDMWYSRILRHEFDVIILSYNNYDCGFIAYKIHEHSCLIQALYVDPKYFRRGFGSSLIKTLELYLHKQDIHNIYLHVQRKNQAAINFYQSLGFTSGSMFSKYLVTMSKQF